MRILGIDQSLTHTGVVVLNDGKIIFTEAIEPDARGVVRLIMIRDRIKCLLENYKPNLVILEGMSFGSVGRIVDIAELFGVLKENIYEHCIENTTCKLTLIPPKTVKKFITGSGNANKALVLLKIYKNYKVEFDDDNIADAFALAMFMNAYFDWVAGKETIKFNIEIFEKYKKYLKENPI